MICIRFKQIFFIAFVWNFSILAVTQAKRPQSIQENKNEISEGIRIKEKGSLKLPIHPRTDDPAEAWKDLKEIYKVEPVVNLDSLLLPDVSENKKLRVVCISDTHECFSKIQCEIPHGDVLIHAGDITFQGDLDIVKEFNKWIGTLPHKHKIVIAGNHDLNINAIRPMLTNCRYVEDSTIVINGIKIFATPWIPKYKTEDFGLERGEPLMKKWNMIPKDTDILVTHTPPVGHGDPLPTVSWLPPPPTTMTGDVELLTTIEKRLKKLKYHVFGHNHHGYGVTTNGRVIFINAAMINIKREAINPAIVFEIKIPRIKKRESQQENLISMKNQSRRSERIRGLKERPKIN